MGIGVLPFSKAQDNAINYSVKEGLPSPETYFVYEDYDGYLWIGTDRGLAKYNGYQFEHFSSADGLTYNTVFNAFEDFAHNIWFTCHDGTITIFDYTTKTFKSFWGNENIQSVIKNQDLKSSWPMALGFSSDTLHIYIASSKGFTSLFIEVNLQDSSLLPREITQAQWRNYDNMAITISEYIPAHFMLRMHFKSHELKISTEKYKLDSFTHDLILQQINELRSSTLLPDEVLLCSQDGVQILRDDQTIHYKTRGASHITRDRDNNYWISTLNQGIYKIPHPDFKLYPTNQYLEKGDKLLSIHNTTTKLLLGSKNGVLLGFSPEVETFTPLAALPIHQAINNITTIHDKIFLDGGWEYLGRDSVTPTVWQQIGAQLVEPYKRGVLIHSRYGSKIQYYPDLDTLNPLLTNSLGARFHALHSPDDEHIYSSTFFDLYKITPDFDVINYTRQYGLDNATVRSISSTADSILLLGTTGSGVVLIKDDRPYVLDKKAGLASDFVSDIISIKPGVLWCATNQGISRIDYTITEDSLSDTFKIQNLNQSNGLGINYVYQLTHRDGRIWAVSEEGIVGFPAEIQLHNPPAPKVHILSLTYEDQIFPNLHVFNYDQNDLEIEFIGLSSQKPEQGKFYKYKLLKDGQNAEWSYTDTRSVSLSHLGPGHYTFYLSASNVNAEWAKPKILQFTIKPHWSARTDLRALTIIVVLLTISYVLKRALDRRNLQQDEKLALEKLKTKINGLELDTLRGQMNPHFIYNSLSLVQKFVLQENKDFASNLINKLAKLLRSSLEYSMYDFIYLDQEINFIRNYMDLELQRFSDRFTFSIYLDPRLDHDLSMPPLLIQPICENAIKHAYNNRLVTIKVYFFYHTDDSIKIIVTDDGIGYSRNSNKAATSEKSSLGLNIISRRITLFNEQGMKAYYSVSDKDTIKRRGTLVKLILPIR